MESARKVSLFILISLFAFSATSFADPSQGGSPVSGLSKPINGGTEPDGEVTCPVSPISVSQKALNRRSNTIAMYDNGSHAMQNGYLCTARMDTPYSPGIGESILLTVPNPLNPESDPLLSKVFLTSRGLACDLIIDAANRKDLVTIHYKTLSSSLQELKIISIGEGSEIDVGLQGKSKGEAITTRGQVTEFSVKVEEGASCRALINTPQGNFYAAVEPDQDDCFDNSPTFGKLCDELRRAYQGNDIQIRGTLRTEANHNLIPYAEVLVESLGEPNLPSSSPRQVQPTKGIKFIPPHSR